MMDQSNSEHEAIVEAIKAGDAARARELGERHVLNGKRRLLVSLDKAKTGTAASERETPSPRILRQRVT